MCACFECYHDFPVSPPGGWKKYLRDNQAEYSDHKGASWRGGKQDILEVKLYHYFTEDVHGPRTVVSLRTEDGCPGKFWQSDDFECIIGQKEPVLLRRRIQMKVGDKAWKTIEIDAKTGEITEYTSKHKI